MISPAIGYRPEEAKRELAKRELARRHLVDFSEYVSPWYHAAYNHRVIGEYLEQVEIYIRTKGKQGIGRLLIFKPPRTGKSEQATIHFPSWVLGRLPDTRVILTSYGADLAVKFSRKMRALVGSERYVNVFGGRASARNVSLSSGLLVKNSEGQGDEETRGRGDGGFLEPVEISSDSRAAEAWDLASPHRGGVTAAGVGGGITGMGAHLFVVDDPFKNREEAERDSQRELVWEWWTSTALTRLEDGGAVVGMLTRWHADDWAGRLIKNMAQNPRATKWVVVCMPAIWEEPVPPEGKDFSLWQQEQMLQGLYFDKSDPLGRGEGQAIWPEKYSVEDYRQIREDIGPYDWEALYQQQPYSRIGGMFKRDWFAIVDRAPDAVRRRVRAWDKAGTAGAGARTSGVCMSLGADGLVYVEHVALGQWSQYEREEQMLHTARMDAQHRGYTVIHHPQDPGSAGKDSAEATNAKLALAGFEAHFAPVTGDKVIRAGPWSSALEAGIVRLVRGGWNAEYIEEHVGFPKGRYKDQVDASSDAFLHVTEGSESGGIFV